MKWWLVLQLVLTLQNGPHSEKTYNLEFFTPAASAFECNALGENIMNNSEFITGYRCVYVHW